MAKKNINRSNGSLRKKKTNRIKAKLFNRKMQEKLVMLMGVVLVSFVALVIRIFWIIDQNGENYTRQVLSQQSYDSKELPFQRGMIMDSKGTILANSELVYTVVIDPYQINHGPETDTADNAYWEPTMEELVKIGLDRSEMEAICKEYPDRRYYIVKKEYPYEDKVALDEEKEEHYATYQEAKKAFDKIKKTASEEDSRYKQAQEEYQAAYDQVTSDNYVQGIVYEPMYIRQYPGGSLACDVLGFATSENVGSFGLEEYYNSTLNGTPGREYGYLNDESNLQRTTIEAEDGNNLILTIDANVQSIIEKYLKQFNDEFADNVHEGYGANNIGCIIQDVSNGNILGMASYPSYDLNNPQDMSVIVGMPMLDEKGNVVSGSYMTQEDVDALVDYEDKSRYLNALWTNFCISSTYEPGSVAKPFTLASGLESGSLKGDETYMCTGNLKIDGWTIKCHNTRGDGLLTQDQAIERSCNVALMLMAQAQGIENFTKFQRIYNFGLKTNIDLAGEARTSSLVFTADEMGNSDLATNSFGQNFNVTMIQMITAFSSLVNGGYFYEPHVVSKITNSAGATVKNIEPRLLKKTVSEETSAAIREATLAVVEGQNGTGKTARPAGYLIGGKTGTAETFPRGNGEYVVSFMGYAPADDPQIAIYVVIDRCNTSPQDNAKYATTVVRNILTEVLPYLNIYMTEPLTAKEEQELKDMNIANTLAYGVGTLSKIPKAIIKNLDTNDDGEADSYDGNGDGIPDNPLDSNGDGITDSVDTSWDGKADWFDTDNDGVCDSTSPKEGDIDLTSQLVVMTDENGNQYTNKQYGKQEWKTYEMDPATGNYIDPETGQQIDPETGYVYSDTTMDETTTDTAAANTTTTDTAAATTDNTASTN